MRIVTSRARRRFWAYRPGERPWPADGSAEGRGGRVPGVFAALRLGLVLAVVGLAACSHAADTSAAFPVGRDAPGRSSQRRPDAGECSPAGAIGRKIGIFHPTGPDRTLSRRGPHRSDLRLLRPAFVCRIGRSGGGRRGRPVASGLEAGFGPPLCQETATGRSCLWRLGAVDLVLTRTPAGKARLLLRSTRLAEDVRLWREQAVPLEGGEDADR